MLSPDCDARQRKKKEEQEELRNVLSHWGRSYVKREKEGDWEKMGGIRIKLLDPYARLL